MDRVSGAIWSTCYAGRNESNAVLRLLHSLLGGLIPLEFVRQFIIIASTFYILFDGWWTQSLLMLAVAMTASTFLSLACIAMCKLSGPGSASHKSSFEEAREQQYMYCKEAQVLRPVRSFYCPRCEICVLRYEQHFPLLNCCIGAANAQPFLFYLIIQASQAIFCAALLSIWVLSHILAHHPDRMMVPIAPVIFIAVGSGGYLMQMAKKMCNLVSRNLTMYEDARQRNILYLKGAGAAFFNPFDLGSAWDNWLEFFGMTGTDWSKHEIYSVFLIPGHPLIEERERQLAKREKKKMMKDKARTHQQSIKTNQVEKLVNS